jgi:hypothetical protein
MLINLKLPPHEEDDSKIQLRCACGHEFHPDNLRKCPKCGRRDLVSMALDGATWKTMAEHKLDTLRKVLEPGGLEEVPEAERAKFREMIQAQVAALESGGDSP